MLAGGPGVGASGHKVDGTGAGAYIIRMAREHSLFDRTDPAAEAAADARAERDAAEGRVIGHSAVRRWLASWGSGARLPRPRSGD
jgi:predicted transcriptional regulator